MVTTIKSLMATLPQVGRITWIGVRPGRREPMLSPDQIMVDPKQGIVGDRYAGRSGKRHLTLMQKEHLAVIASNLGKEPLSPALFRRNLVVTGLNLLALKKRLVRIGDAEIEVTGECHPCSYMEEQLGPGGYNAVRGHGGITARVVTGGIIRVGDSVRVIDGDDTDFDE